MFACSLYIRQRHAFRFSSFIDQYIITIDLKCKSATASYFVIMFCLAYNNVLLMNLDIET